MKLIRSWSAYVLAYLLWMVSTVFGAFVLFQIREAYLSATTFNTMARTQGNATEQFYAALQMRSLDVWSLLIEGLIFEVWIVGIVAPTM